MCQVRIQRRRFQCFIDDPVHWVLSKCRGQREDYKHKTGDDFRHRLLIRNQKPKNGKRDRPRLKQAIIGGTNYCLLESWSIPLSIFGFLVSNQQPMSKVLPCLMFIVLSLTPAFAQDPVNRIIDEALKPSSLDTNLAHLTDQIGGRIPGTPAMKQAVQW